jgi:hypothetical protein
MSRPKIGQQFVEQIARRAEIDRLEFVLGRGRCGHPRRPIPQMMVGIDDGEIGLENRFFVFHRQRFLFFPILAQTRAPSYSYTQ